MEILRPDVMWIEGRCYRINDIAADIHSFKEHELYENEYLYNSVDNEEDDIDDCEVVKINEERYKATIHVPKHYLGSIIGKKGAIKVRIERDTKTEIKIPRLGHDGDITILGPSEANVKAAWRRISMIVLSSRFKQKATHFISIPMNTSSVIENFNKFKENVLKDSSDRGLEESLFIHPLKLHLTLGMMCLMDNEERISASKLLTEVRDKIVLPLLEHHTLQIRLKGLQYMNDDPKEIDVLYGLVKEENGPHGILQKLSDEIVDYFCKAGFMQREHNRANLKLHVTLLNSKYRSHRNQNDESDFSSRKGRETFDGSRILQQFEGYDFGVVELTNIHLSQRHSMSPDGYYQPTCVISCVSN